MTVLQFTVLVWMGSFVAGFLGSLTGLGGGVVLVPLLTLVFKVDIRYAVGASLVSVIATSSGAAAAYVKEGFSNIRIGMFLEVATTIGALVGAFLATKVPTRHRNHLWSCAALLSLSFCQDAIPEARSATRSSGYVAEDERKLSYRSRPAAIFRPRGAGRIRLDVWRRNAFRVVGNRVRCSEGAGNGPGHANPLQSFHYHQQLHDWSDCSG